jgi:hypothetical protein
MEEEVRMKCRTSKKARFVKDDKYETKKYLKGEVGLTTAKKILRTRMNMTKVPGNYKGGGSGMCTLCEQGEGSTEHYFQCKSVSLLTDIWEVTANDLRSQEVKKMKDVARFMEKVEIMLNPGIK